MDIERLVNKFFQDLWFGEDLEAIDKLFSPTVIINGVVKKTIGKKEKIEIAKSWFQAFPVRNAKLEKIARRDNIVSVHWSSIATHQGSFYNLSPSGKTVAYEGMCYYKMRDGLVSEYYAVSDVAMNLVKSGAFPLSFHEKSEDPFNNDLIGIIKTISNKNLTRREIEVASLWLSGCSIKESARTLFLTSSTIEEYRSRTKDKLNVKDKKSLYNLLREQGVLELYFHFAKALCMDYSMYLLSDTHFKDALKGKSEL